MEFFLILSFDSKKIKKKTEKGQLLEVSTKKKKAIESKEKEVKEK